MTPEAVLEYLKVIGEYLSPAYLAVRQYVIILAVKKITFQLLTLIAVCGAITWLLFWLRREKKRKPDLCTDWSGDWYAFAIACIVTVDIGFTLLISDLVASNVITLIAPDIPTVIWLIQQVK